MLEILLPVALFSIILVAIHSYFGIEILKRGVVFADLAIGQAAAVGVAIGMVTESQHSFVYSITCALIFSTLILYAQKKIQNKEAFIGLLYLFGSSMLMLILSYSSNASEHFFALLATDILFISTDQLIYSALIYAVIGAFLYAVMPKLSTFLQEVIFFWFFAITVTLSVKIAGVLVVFAILIAPAIVSLSQNKVGKILFSSIYGAVIITVSLFLSYIYDFPTGYGIVFMLSFSSIAILLIIKR